MFPCISAQSCIQVFPLRQDTLGTGPQDLQFWSFQLLAVPSQSCPAPVLATLKKVLPDIAMFQQMKCINFLDPDPLHIPGLLFCEQSANSLNSSSEEQMLRGKEKKNHQTTQNLLSDSHRILSRGKPEWKFWRKSMAKLQ